MPKGEQYGDPLRPWFVRATIGFVAVTVLTIALIGAGLLDPKPLGKLQATLGPFEETVPASSENLPWLAVAAPGQTYSIRLSAARLGGERDAGYGLAVGGQGNAIVAAVSPVGYLALWRQTDSGALGQAAEAGWQIPWRTWPHVGLDQEANEIWLDVQDGQLVQVRINRERLWSGELPVEGRQIGLWTASYGEALSVRFNSVEIYSPSP